MAVGSKVTDTVREVYSCSAEREENGVVLTIRADGFLYNMVRIIVGTLFQVGGGVIPPERMKEILEAKDRSLAGDTARPEGLTLMSIEYE